MGDNRPKTTDKGQTTTTTTGQKMGDLNYTQIHKQRQIYLYFNCFIIEWVLARFHQLERTSKNSADSSRPWFEASPLPLHTQLQKCLWSCCSASSRSQYCWYCKDNYVCKCFQKMWIFKYILCVCVCVLLMERMCCMCMIKFVWMCVSLFAILSSSWSWFGIQSQLHWATTVQGYTTDPGPFRLIFITFPPVPLHSECYNNHFTEMSMTILLPGPLLFHSIGDWHCVFQPSNSWCQWYPFSLWQLSSSSAVLYEIVSDKPRHRHRHRHIHIAITHTHTDT